MKRVFLKIFGVVQGVVFRLKTQEMANNLGLSGWVKNAPDGTVEIMVEGEELHLKKFVNWCKVGPRLAKVERLEEKWGDVEKPSFSSFEIVY